MAPPTHTPPSSSRSTRPAGRLGREAHAFQRLVQVMHILRGPAGCPWDQRQTHASLRGYLLEEAYEAAEAIDDNDLKSLRGELGDVLLQCVFHAELAREAGAFTITDVVQGLLDKLIARHPHVFAADGRHLTARERRAAQARTPADVARQWARVKADERKRRADRGGTLSGVPRALPALLRAQRLAARAASVGFDWDTPSAVLDKVTEELAELRVASTEGADRLSEELGDLLFALVSFARKQGLDAERVLTQASDKFTRRFEAVEALLARKDLAVQDATPAGLDEAWNFVKAREQRPRPRRIGAPSTTRPAPKRRRSRS